MCFIHTAELRVHNSPVYSPIYNDSLPTDSLRGALAEGNLKVPKLMVPKADSRSTDDRKTNTSAKKSLPIVSGWSCGGTGNLIHYCWV